MLTARSLSYHYFFRTLILLAFSSYIVILSKSDALQYYIAPRMMIYVKLASVLIYVMACFQGYLALRAYWGKTVTCDCEQEISPSVFRNTIAYGLLLLPLLVGYLLPDTALSSAMAASKGMNLSASTSLMKKNAESAVNNAGPSSAPSAVPTPTSAAPAAVPSASLSDANHGLASDASLAMPKTAPSDADLQAMFKADNEWEEDFSRIGMILYKKNLITVNPDIYMEILSSIDLYKDNFIGKKIELTGFVYREDQMTDSQFVVGRFAVSCCSADATPYGVMVDFPTGSMFPKDMWVKVTGTIQNVTYKGNDLFKIQASNVEKITAPSSPYVYPNFEPLKILK
ncbi:TIGR03943 family putative permease subunit [Paenibacillus ferrarius]|uniref:TIGR03943 family putative permease subunit n=1 Tax=Paenibacillus ferrarius TaxID=1469647 RepID=UPI003D298C55